MSEKYIRGQILDFIKDPSRHPDKSYRYFPDGLLIIKEGKILKCGPYDQLSKTITDKNKILDYQDKLIVPGFIDTHIHYPQTDMVAAYGEQLLEWLTTYTFPNEEKLQDPAIAKDISKFFIKELFRNGTTTALVFSTVHSSSVNALFEEAQKFNMRIISGKVLMDRNAPETLLDTPESGYEESKKLIKKWHNVDRLLYAITPRFAPTSTSKQLQMAQKLKKEHPSVYLHTHLSENKSEIEWVKELYPERKDYLDVYHHYELTGKKSVFAHCIHLSDNEFKIMKETDSAISFCPTSNLFLGSGLFKFKKAKKMGIKIGIGSDIGAGTSFNTLQTLNEAYKVNQLQNEKFSALEGLYQATLGGAKALDIDEKIGNFEENKEADFVIIDLNSTPLIKRRMKSSNSLEEKLFILMILGDDRSIFETFVDGKSVYQRES